MITSAADAVGTGQSGEFQRFVGRRCPSFAGDKRTSVELRVGEIVALRRASIEQLGRVAAVS